MGHRKAIKERAAYKAARKQEKLHRITEFGMSTTAVGRKRLMALNNESKKARQAEVKTVNAKAALNAAKKGDNKEKAAKAEMKTYVKEMYKSGLVGSAKDKLSGGRSEALYNDLKVKKGKKYADTVLKKTQNKAIGTFVGSAAVVVGTQVVANILQNR